MRRTTLILCLATLGPLNANSTTLDATPATTSTSESSRVIDLHNDQANKQPTLKASKTRTLTGILKGKIGSKKRFPFSLEKDGKRVAYVDLSDILLDDFRPYLNRTVIITGEFQKLASKKPPVIIKAQTIQTVSN